MRVVIRTELASCRSASVGDDGDNRRTTAVGRRRCWTVSPMATVLLALVLTICACSPVGALRCYCSTDKGAAECVDNVCEIRNSPGDSGARPACAALNHSVTGIHYACVRSKHEVDETTCKVGPTKNGGTVTACWCRDADYCNEHLFDRTLMESESSSDDADDSSLEHTDHSAIERPHHPPIEQHEQPASDTDDIHITAAKIDDMGEVDDSEIQSSKSDYYDDDDDEDDGDVAVGSEDEDNKEDMSYYEPAVDPFVEHTSEHTTTTKKKPLVFETTAAPTYYPRMFTAKKLTTTLYWRPSVPTTTTTPATTTTKTATTTVRTTTARVTSSPPRKAPSVDDSQSGKMPKGVSSDNDEKRIKAQYPSNAMITQSVPRAVYGASSTTVESPSSKVGDGVDSRAKSHRSGYGSGVNSRMDADLSEEVEDHSDKTAERTGGGKVYLNASGRALGSECLFALALVLSVLPVLL